MNPRGSQRAASRHPGRCSHAGTHVLRPAAGAATEGPGKQARPHVIVVGAGIAGLVTALALSDADAPTRPLVTVLCKGRLGSGSTAWAQGGIAAAIAPGDSPDAHAADTRTAGAGLSDRAAVQTLCEGGPEAIAVLERYGVVFDRNPGGERALGREGAHRTFRILHAGGDSTGAVIAGALAARVRERVRAGLLRLREESTVMDLLVSAGTAGRRVHGVRLLDGTEMHADAVVLATGGAGQVFARTTNPEVCTGDGIALALRAGAAVEDLEFVQFHPTVLDQGPFLISEAVRGEGAMLIDADGRRFMPGVHPDAELAPRDVVARAIDARARLTGHPVHLDATGLGRDFLRRRFPGIDAGLRARGLDWTVDPVPVTPAAHYLMGGVVTDLSGRTSLPGLYAAGETARTGVHGANRLASNSLLEGVVFGMASADAIMAGLAAAPAAAPSGRPVSASWTDAPPSSRRRSAARDGAEPVAGPGAAPAFPTSGATAPVPAFSRERLQALMWEHCGLVRTTAGLDAAARVLAIWASGFPSARGGPDVSAPTNPAGPAGPPGPANNGTAVIHTGTPACQRAAEDRNLLTVAQAMVAAARRRTESIGAHRIDDVPPPPVPQPGTRSSVHTTTSRSRTAAAGKEGQ